MPTVQQVIDTILQEIPGAPYDETVDTLKSGDPNVEVTGIVTTFLASMDVLRRAVKQGANLIITHEPTYYNHFDDVPKPADDPVIQAKRAFIEENKLAIWRFHDYWHRHQPDGIVTGMLKQLEWESLVDSEIPVLLHLSTTSLQGIVTHLKTKLGVPVMRVIGMPEMPVSRAALMVGSAGGRLQIGAFGLDIDLLICGEINEWEVSEYVRDARALGLNKALIVTGHAASEEGGMAYLVDWLSPRVPGVTITHIATGDAFTYL